MISKSGILGSGSCLGGLGCWWGVFEESMLLCFANRVLVGEPCLVSGGELMVVVEASFEL